MQSRVSARVAGRSPVECSHRLCFPPQPLVVVLSLVGQIVHVRRILLILDVVALNPCSFLGRRYWPRRQSSCDKSLSFISWIRWSIRGRYTGLWRPYVPLDMKRMSEWETQLFASRTLGCGWDILCCCLPVVLGMLGSMSNSAVICLPRSYTSFQTDESPFSCSSHVFA